MNLPLRTLLTATVAVCSLHSAVAEDPVPAPAVAGSPAPTDAKPAGDTPRYALKNQSTFALPADTRSPFWPIGWVRKVGAPTQTTQGPKTILDERAFNVTSILVGVPSLAVINGRSYGEGEFVRLPKSAGPLRVRLHRISDGSVSLQYEDQIILVALRRPELAAKRADDELLNDQK